MKRILLSLGLGLFSVIAYAETSSITITLNKTDFCIGDSVEITVSWNRSSNIYSTDFSSPGGLPVSGNPSVKSGPTSGTLKFIVIAGSAGSQQFTVTVMDSFPSNPFCYIIPYNKSYVVHNYPVAYFRSLNAKEQCENRGFQFNLFSYQDSSKASPGSSLVSWKWDFGDGNTGFTNVANHSYNNIGSYTVTMIVTDNYGCKGTYSDWTLVHPVPVAKPRLSGNITQCMKDNQYVFLDSSFFVQPGVTESAHAKWKFGNGDSSFLHHVNKHYNTAGDFLVQFVTYTDAGCGDTTNIGLMQVKASPAAKTISGPATGIIQSTLNYSVTNTSGSTFNWTISGGVQQSGGSSNSISVHWNGSAPWTLMVKEINSDGCVGDSSFLNVSLSANGIREFAHAAISCYPNPVKDKLSLGNAGADASVIISDTYGRLICELMLETGAKKDMDMSKLPAGIYFVKIQSGDGSEMRKVLVTR